MTTIVEKKYQAAADALGIELDYPATITEAKRRRDAGADLATMRPRDSAHELATAKGVRQWDSILAEIAAHNAKCAEAQNAIGGGLVSRLTAQIDRELTNWVPDYAQATNKTVSGILASLTDIADACPSLSPEQAIHGGYGAELTAMFAAVGTLTKHIDVAIETAPSDRQEQAARALALVTDPPSITPIRRKPANRINAGGEVVSSADDVARRDSARRLMSDWMKDKTITLHALARGQYPSHTLSAADADNYLTRVEAYRNTTRQVVVGG